MKKLYKIQSALLAVLCAACVHAEIFETIDDLKEYAKNHPQTIPIDNQDYLNPEYVKYLDAHAPTIWDRMLKTIGLKHKSAWQPKTFIDLLRRVTQKRKKDGFHGIFLQRKEVSQDDHFIVWGSLHGAFHSLVYTLEYLIDQKIIDKNLKFVAPKYFMVFSGNVVDCSIYSLETLTIVLRLLDANPDRVFYAKGNHESNSMWRDYDLRDELETNVAVAQGMMPPYKDGLVPFTDDLEALFDTLPLAVYLGMKTVDTADGIRIGHFTREDFQLSYEELSYLLNTPNQTLFPLPIEIPKERSEIKSSEVIAMTEGSSDLIPNYNDQGLRLLPPDQGTTAWSVLSAQNDSFQKLYKFLIDSYVDITIALPMQKSTITQHYQDVRNRSGFKTGRVYNIFSGQSDEQFRAQQKVEVLRVGATIDLQGEAAVLGGQVRNGLSLAINKQNQQGIVAGQIIELVILNDSHVFANMRRNIESLHENYKVPILIGVEENMMARSYFDLVMQHDMLVLFPFTSVDTMRSSKYNNIIHYGPSYKDEADISTRYILDTIAPRKIGIFYEKGKIGEDALRAVKAVCKEKGFTELIEIPFMANQLTFQAQLEQIQRENPDVLGIFTSVEVGQEFIRQVGIQNLAKRTLYGLSSFGAQTFKRYYQSRGLRMILTNLIPDPFKSDLPIVQEFRKEAEDNNITFSPQALEAYVTASIFIEALRIIKGPINAKTIKQTLESMKNYEFKGLKLNFNTELRELSDAIWLDLGDGTPWKQFTARKYEISAKEKVKSEQEVTMGADRMMQKAQESSATMKESIQKMTEPAPAPVPIPVPISEEAAAPQLGEK